MGNIFRENLNTCRFTSNEYHKYIYRQTKGQTLILNDSPVYGFDVRNKNS